MRKAIAIWLSIAALILSAPVSAQFIPGGGGGGGAGSGTVTNIATGACLTGGPITTTGTVSGTYVINAQTGTTYTVLSTDACALVTFSNASAIAVTLPQATGSFAAGFGFDVQNKGVGLVTITPTTSTINGLSTLTLATNQGCTIVSDGTNWQVSSCTGAPITWNQTQSNSIKTLSISTVTFTPDASQNNYKIVLTSACASAACILANPSASFTAGQAGTIEVVQPASGGPAAFGTYGSSYISAGGTSTITYSTGANAIDLWSYFTIDSTHILLSQGALNASH